MVPHAVFFTQRLHKFGSASTDESQFGEIAGLIAMSKQVAPSQIVQQPKQSQPGGVMPPQTIVHFGGTGSLPTGG